MWCTVLRYTKLKILEDNFHGSSLGNFTSSSNSMTRKPPEFSAKFLGLRDCAEISFIFLCMKEYLTETQKKKKCCLDDASFIYTIVSKIICMLDERQKCNATSYKAYKLPHFRSICAGGRFEIKSTGSGSFVIMLSVLALPQLLVRRVKTASKGKAYDG